jgi:hypothetical protein
VEPVATVCCCCGKKSSSVILSCLILELSLERMVDDNGVQYSQIAGRTESSHGTPAINNQCFDAVLMSPSAAWVFRRICVWRGSAAAAEAKKADDASMDILRTPRPPDQTGRLA